MAVIIEQPPLPPAVAADPARRAQYEADMRSLAQEASALLSKEQRAYYSRPVDSTADAAAKAREAAAARARAEAEARAKAKADAEARASREAKAKAEQEAREHAAVREAAAKAREEAARKARTEAKAEAEAAAAGVVLPPAEPEPEPPPEPVPTPEGYERVEEAGEVYFTKQVRTGVLPSGETAYGAQFHKMMNGQLVAVLEPSRIRTERLYGVTGTERDITPESVTTEGMRPDEILIAMKDAGADAATLIKYMEEHPSARRGAKAGQLVRGLQAQFEELETITGEERIAAATALGVMPEDYEELPQELKDAYAEGDKAFNTAIEAYNIRVKAEAEAELAELKETHIQVTGSEWYSKEDLARLKEEDYEQYQAILSSGGSAGVKVLMERRTTEFEATLATLPVEYQQVYKERGYEGYVAFVEQERLEFEAANTQLPDGQWISKDKLNDLKTSDDAFEQKMYEAFIRPETGGFVAVDALIVGQQALYQAQMEERQANLDKLGDYKVTSFSEEKLKTEIKELTSLYAIDDIIKKRDEIAVGVGGDVTTYDVSNYLLEHPGDIATPIGAGFDEAYIINLNKAVNATRKHWVDGKLQVYEAYLAEVAPEHLKTLTGLTEEEITGLRMPLAEFLERYENAHPIAPEKISWLPLYGDPAGEALRKEAYDAYAEIYGRAALAAAGGTGIATVLFAPARVLEPRVELKDITPLEWGIGAAQVILYASPLWLPKLIKVAPKFNPVGRVRVAMADGSTRTVWKGVKFWDSPVIGKSGDKLILGTRGMQYPELLKISPGWKPVTGLETKIMASRNAMQQIGFADTDIARVMSTLQARGTFAGQQSQYITREMLTDPVKTLNSRSVEAVLNQAAIEGKNIKVWYGSTSIKQQLAPKLRTWRIPADIDIQTTMNLDDTISLTNRLLAKLKITQGAKNVRISAKSPTMIESLGADGQWHHAVDIHALGDPTMSSVLAGEGAYGRLYAEPPVTVNYGDTSIKIMTLSESGVRKAGSILEWRAGAIGPAAHRTKDIVDYYVILQSFSGDDIANAWALAYGYDPTALAAMAADTLPEAISWMYVASSASISPTALVSLVPLLTLTSPALTSAALSMPIGSLPSVTPGELPSMITIRPSTISAELEASSEILPPASVVSPEVISQAISQPIPAQSVPPSTPSSAVKSPIISPSVIPSKVPSVAPSTAVSPPSVVPSAAPSVAPSPVAVSPSIAPSVPPSHSPSVSPSVPPSTPSYPPSVLPSYLISPPLIYPPKSAPPLLPLLIPEAKEAKKRKKHSDGTIVWKQGAWWKIIPPPYSVKKPLSSRTPPVGVTVLQGTPQQTLTFIGGVVPAKNISFDLGVTDGFIDVRNKRIVFKGYGRLTDVGLRIPGPTKGMSVEETVALGISPIQPARLRAAKKALKPVSTLASAVSLKGLEL